MNSAPFPQKSTSVRPFAALALDPMLRVLQVAARLAPGLVIPALARRFLTPRSRRAGLSLLGARECLEIRIGKNSVRVGLWGSGPLVALVHGWGGSGAQLASLREALLFSGFSVAVFDGPAHGSTSGESTNAAEFTAIIQRLAERHPVHAVIGHSLGGLAVAVAVARGVAANGIVLLAPLPSLDFAVDQFQQTLQLSSATRDAILERVEYTAGVKRQEWSLRASLPAELPLLLVHDRDDRRIDIAHSRHLSSSRRALRHVETEGLGHSRILDDARVLDQVTAFLRGLPAPTRAATPV